MRFTAAKNNPGCHAAGLLLSRKRATLWTPANPEWQKSPLNNGEYTAATLDSFAQTNLSLGPDQSASREY
jgi:hypothetical protein